MTGLRDDLAHFETYKIKHLAQHNLADNENRLIDWSDLPAEAMQELSVGDLTYYGDNRYQSLLEAYADYLNVSPNQLVQGVGSDQLAHMIVMTFLKAGDVFVTVSPDFFMYKVFNDMQGSIVETFPLEWTGETYRLDGAKLAAFATAVEAKVIMLSNPNNPSSVAFPADELEKVVTGFSGIVVIDEAYIDFAEVASFVHRVTEFDSLIVLRTLSKSFGLAGLRLGFAITNPELATSIDKVIPPYSMPNIVAKIGQLALGHADKMAASVQDIKKIRNEFLDFLRSLPESVVLPSQSNFVTFQTPYNNKLYQAAQAADFAFQFYTSGPMKGFIRLSMGRAEETQELSEIFQKTADSYSKKK